MEEYIMLRIGIIGAGTISVPHLEGYRDNPYCEVVAIADLNTKLAQERADAFGVPTVVSDYHDILNDKTIDAVSILLPTFLHKKVTIEALKQGKHVLCEKPPAMNADEVRECVQIAKEVGKVLMYGFVCRFRGQAQYLKNYIKTGKMGEIIFAEVERTSRYSYLGGWFMDKTKARGGVFFDCAIHEIDLALYMMGYPKIKSVTGSTSYINKDFTDKLNGHDIRQYSLDAKKYDNTVETSASGYITFENGSYLYVKAGRVVLMPENDCVVQICGEKAGAALRGNGDRKLEIIELDSDNYLRDVKPSVDVMKPYNEEINHFVDCFMNGTECICKNEDVISLMEIMDAVYKSAELGKTVYFE